MSKRWDNSYVEVVEESIQKAVDEIMIYVLKDYYHNDATVIALSSIVDILS